MLERSIVGGVRWKRRGCGSAFSPCRAAGGVSLACSKGCSRSRCLGGIGGDRAVAGGDGCSRGAGHVSALFVVPGGNVIFHRGGIVSGEQAVFRQLDSLLDDEGGVGPVGEIFLVVAIVLDGVVDQSAEEGNIASCANLAE